MKRKDITNPVQSGEHKFSTSANEIKLFLAINIIMTYIKYPNHRLHRPSNTVLCMHMTADAVLLKRFEEIKKILTFD
jgi:hypothetical protein